jgi:hypothetical protein
MANAYRAGINRPQDVIHGFFVTYLPFAQRLKRLTAWQGNYRMALFNEGTDEDPVMVYRPNRIWCAELGDAFDNGLDQTPDPCLIRAFYNSPD